MLEQCDVTVVIPTYNRMGLIARAIESALAQTIQPAQVIVVDDGSTDDTEELCKAYAPKVQYVWQRNAGVSAACNTGIRLTRHPWVAFLASDDYWISSHLERMVAAIRETAGEAAFYFSDMQMPEEDGGGTLWEKSGFSPRTPFHLIQDASAWMLMKRQPTMVQSSVISKRALDSVGGMDQSKPVGEDTDLFCRLGIGGVACAVSGIGCVQTSDDRSNIRLTAADPFGSEKYLAVKCKIWRDVLDREKRLPSNLRRLVTYKLAGSHLGLGKVMWRSGRPTSAIWHFLIAAKSHPSLATWMLRNGTSKGYEETLRPVCAEECAERVNQL